MMDFTVLSEQQWQESMEQHHRRADSFTKDHLARRRAGKHHPVYDFLFEYYPVRIAHLHKWHPGFGVALSGLPPHKDWKFYHVSKEVTSIDSQSLWAQRHKTIKYIRELLAKTNTNPAHFDCFGLHEWAMVYQANSTRHELPLRLGAAGTNEVVENNTLRCTHFDAFRFFTPPARPLNFTILTRENQPQQDQCGCLHANMDIYKWATKLQPLIPGSLWLDAFSLAWDARVLDMEASPYDCRDYGLGVVAIETAEGKAHYVRRQRELAVRANQLRERIIKIIDDFCLSISTNK
ncbi:3-methyladenine DNA glycosylase [Corynebacterium sp. sy017]|uniref:3-methyladenine DNA glycosylase n=1 Tax=unclassified Corynebacterium TaxID=2624378 RepID=UPI0011871D0E|nr:MULTISPECIES: 3-methyladenine DNA glycosylase [unclassified Corynebacterium]MBP3087576.1 3-methyladenine DNA glycosylase [Corynebacterium sp. sy017]TSD92152.1 3-methyladenine DNA glycosylase [Corynebacterium sp. SY003]